MTDEKLISLYRTDTRRAVRLTAEIYYGYVYKIVSGRLAGAAKEDVEETVSDVFIRLWQDIDRIDLKKGSIKAYISVIAQSIAKNRCLKLSRQQAMPLEEDTVADSDDMQMRITDREALINALKALDPTDRKIVILRFYYLCPHAEIAKAVGLKETAVRKRLERTLKKLRSEELL
ncbi:MAG: sigma-70 family RNA polymerase sigma factor [Ruminococcus sp.]|nr:sigma-70 family RNA polymerase sigma factor [Ruminococcus sp.]